MMRAGQGAGSTDDEVGVDERARLQRLGRCHVTCGWGLQRRAGTSLAAASLRRSAIFQLQHLVGGGA